MIFRSVSSRLAAWMFVGSTLVLGLTGSILLEHARQQLLEQTQREAAALAGGTAARIQSRVADAIAVTRMLRGALPQRATSAEALIRDVMRGHPDLSGVSAAFVATDIDGSPLVAPLVLRDPQGALRTLDLNTLPEPFRAQPWFTDGLACTAGCWRQPFLALSRDSMIVGYREPMEGSVGVVTSEFTLGWLQNLIDSMPRPAGGYTFVMDHDGRFLAHEKPGFVGTQASAVLLGSIKARGSDPFRLTAAKGARVDEPSWAYIAPIEGTPWLFGLIIPENRIYAGVRRVLALNLAMDALGLLVLAIVVLAISRRLLAPLAALSAQAERIAQGDIGHTLPVRHSNDEVGRLSRSFAHMRSELATHIEAVAASTRVSERLASQLDIARQIQTSMLPPSCYDDPAGAFGIEAHLQPAQAVGGDLYLYLVLEDRLWLMVGDVSDKGIAAALFMARTVTLARTLARDAVRVEQLLVELNRELVSDNEACMFVTLVCATVERDTGLLRVASAGHDAPALCRDGASSMLAMTTGPALGLTEEVSYPVVSLTLRPGDTLVMFSDGITEADDGRHGFFGPERLLRAVENTEPMCSRLESLLRAVAAHTANQRQSDDIALLAFSWQGRAMMPPFQQRFSATQDDVFVALDAIERFVRSSGAPDETCGDIRLACEELLINMVEHGGARHIEVAIARHATSMELRLADDGAAFDPLAQPSPVDSADIGGLGIHLARHVAQAMHYRRDEPHNRLTLRFDFLPTPADEPT